MNVNTTLVCQNYVIFMHMLCWDIIKVRLQDAVDEMIQYPSVDRPHNAAGSTSGSRARHDTHFSYILSFLLLLIQEGQLSFTGKSMCTKYWLP